MTDVDALNAALAVEHEVIYGYGVVGAQVSAAGRGLAQAGYDSHRAWRDRLTAAIRDAGGVPVVAEPAYALDRPVANNAAAERFAVRLEAAGSVAYEGLVIAAQEAQLRGTAADALVTCATRATRWRLLGGNRHPIAFPGRGA